MRYSESKAKPPRSLSRRLSALVLGLVLAIPNGAWGLPRVAIISSSQLHAYQEATRGYIATLDCEAEHYDLGGDLSNAERVLGSALSRSPDVVLAVGAKAAIACSQIPRNIPVVFCMVQDPKRYDLPKGNMTGVRNRVSDRRQLGLLLKLKPSIRRVGVLYSPKHSRGTLERAEEAATDLNISLVPVPIKSEAEAAKAVRGGMSEVDAIWFIADPVVATPGVFDLLLRFSLDNGIPLLTFARSLVRSGALIACYADARHMGSQAAELTKRVLRGDHVRGKMIAPSKESFSVNTLTAKALGIELPPKIMAEADSVFP